VLLARCARRAFLHLHRRHKAIAATALGVDAPLRLPIVTNGLTDRHETGVQHGIATVLLRPEVFQEFIFRDDPIPLGQEIGSPARVNS
jgi:hypothetical protein